MPTTISERGPMKFVFFNASTGQTSESASSYYQFREESIKQSSTRRVKPAILWKNPTSYGHITNTSVMTYGVETFPSGNWTRAPTAFWISAGAGGGANLFTMNQSDVSGRLRAQIKNQNVNLAQSLAEYRQASSMFLGAARDILKTFRSLRNGRAFADFVRMLQRPRNRNERAIAGRWLEYQYGLKPLLSDIYGTAESLSKKLQEGVLMSTSATQSGKLFVRDLAVMNPRFSRYWEAEASIKGKAYYTINHAGVKALASYGISNPIHLAWELIPYSFVVDWLFPVGDFLSSLDALNGTSSLVVVYTHRRKWTCTATAWGGTHTYTQKIYARESASSLPMPKLSYKPSTSLTKVLNGLALLSQIRTSR